MIYLLHITVYLLDTLMTFLSTIFVFCCFSPIFFIVNLITMEMLGIYNGWSDMARWDGERVLFLYGKACYWCTSESFFWYSYFCIVPKTFFSTSCILYAWLAISHVPFSEFCINHHVKMSLCLYSLQFLHIVLCWNAWWKLWMKWYGMTDEFVLVDCRLQLHVYEVDISFYDATWWGKSHVFEMFWS